ncbi:MAG: hypothetical protein IT287_03465 [Bdellovibrionaceae bacterium]|nr:hypothetical protein [Pseudobdellovibrionaceae bacterium]
MLTYNIYSNTSNSSNGMCSHMKVIAKKTILFILLIFCKNSSANTCVDIFSSTNQYDLLFSEYNMLVPLPAVGQSGLFEYIVRNGLIIGDVIYNSRGEGTPIVGTVVGQERGQFLVRLIELNNVEGHTILLPFNPKNLRLTEEQAQALVVMARWFGPGGLSPVPAPIETRH